MDQTVAYFGNLSGVYWDSGCGYMKERPGALHEERLYCIEKNYAGFLCEMDTRLPSVQNTIRFPHPGNLNESNSVRTTTCPQGGHLTHEFLACDVESSCWARDVAASVSCKATRNDDPAAFCGAALTPLPPSFPCSNGRGEVPYTLVCDHRPDCSDSSDEKFCVFPPCDVMTQFDCGNQQVRFAVDLAAEWGVGGGNLVGVVL